MTIILISNDLMAASNIRGPAQAQNVPLTLTSNIESVLTHCNEPGVDLVLLDLTTPGLDPQALVPRLRSAPSPPGAIVAFGPHVQEGWLAAATAAGCDEVLTRGQFHTQAAALLKRYMK